MDSDGSIMTYEDKKDRNEYPTWFMGYHAAAWVRSYSNTYIRVLYLVRRY